MPFNEILLLAIALAMDAFSVSITQGMLISNQPLKLALKLGIVFGFFQALMPLTGYLLGSVFAAYIQSIDHWIAFILLGFLGIRMIKESLQEEELQETSNENTSLNFKTVIVLAIATSIDALAAGVTFAFLKTNILMAIAIIGILTAIICFIGVYIGYICRSRFKFNMELIGGCILIILGLKILLEHLGIIG